MAKPPKQVKREVTSAQANQAAWQSPPATQKRVDEALLAKQVQKAKKKRRKKKRR